MTPHEHELADAKAALARGLACHLMRPVQNPGTTVFTRVAFEQMFVTAIDISIERRTIQVELEDERSGRRHWIPEITLPAFDLPDNDHDPRPITNMVDELLMDYATTWRLRSR